MLSTYAKFSLSDASDFLNSDDDPEGDNDREKSGSPFEVNKFDPHSGQNSSSEAEDNRRDYIAEDDDMRKIACKKRPFSSQSASGKEDVKINPSVEKHSTTHLETVQKKRAGPAWRCPIQINQ
jgi:hypothetical protein